MKLYILVVLMAVGMGRSHAFFDMDFFKQFSFGNQGFDSINQRTRDHATQLEDSLRTAFSEVRDIEPMEPLEPLAELEPFEDNVEYAEPEAIPSYDESSGTPFGLEPAGSHHMFPGGFFGMFGRPGAGRGPWWKGSNVCVEREEIDESKQRNDTKTETSDEDYGGMFGSFEFSSCQQTSTRYTCTSKVQSRGVKKTMIVKYQCCHGYARMPGDHYCTQLNLKSVLETAEDLGAKDFVKLLTTHGLTEKLTNQNVTLFAPTDEVWRDFMDKMQQENQVEFFVPGSEARRRRRSTDDVDEMTNEKVTGVTLREIVAGHITSGILDVNEMSNEKVLLSENDNSTLRFNVYPHLGERIVTVNCARLTNVDNYATNGIVHAVDRIVRPITKTLAELLEEDPQLETLREMLAKAELTDMLKKPGHVTLFAPTSAAFEKLPKATLDRLNEGTSCLKNVMRHHMLSHSLCSAAIAGQVSTYNHDGQVMHLQGRADGKLFVEGVQIVVKDVMGTNGIIHVIDEVIVPDSAKSVSEILNQNNLTEFVSLLDQAGLTDSINAMNNVTIFAPSNAALSSPVAREQLDKLKEDKEKLREVLMYHAAASEVQSCDLANDLMLKTNMKEQDVRVNLYASQPLFMGARHRATAQCARLIDVDHKACGGVVHVLDRIMLPPSGNILQLIDTEDKFSILKTIIKDTEIEKELRETSPVTFLAPVNAAFQDLEAEDLEKLKTDKQLANSVLKRHVLPEALCCSGVTSIPWPFTRRAETLNGDSLSLRRDPDGNIHLGSVMVLDCDTMATNGLVHAVNRVMLPRRMTSQGVSFKSTLANRFGNPNLEVLLFGL